MTPISFLTAMKTMKVLGQRSIRFVLLVQLLDNVLQLAYPKKNMVFGGVFTLKTVKSPGNSTGIVQKKAGATPGNH